MKARSVPIDEIAEGSVPVERGYAAWKRTKIERGIEQAKDRDALIPAAQIWRAA